MSIRTRHTASNASSVLKQNFAAVSITRADEFNAFFSFSGQSSLVSVLTTNSTPSVLESAFLPLCTIDDLRCILFGCNRRKTAGVDGISVYVLCRKFDSLKDVFLAIINLIIETQIIPEGLKYGLFIPLIRMVQKIG